MAFKRDLFLLGFGRVVSAVVALVSIRVATALLVPEQFGKLALLNAVLIFCGLFLINPIAQHINLHTHAWWDEGTLYSRMRSYKGYVLLVSIVGMIAVAIMYRNNPIENILFAALATFLMVLSYTWNGTLIPMLNMLGFRAQSVGLTLLTLIPGMLFSIIFTIAFPSATSWFMGQAIGLAIGSMGANYIFKGLLGDSISRNQKRPLISKIDILKYCLPLALATGLMWILLSGYRFLIEAYWGLVELGLLAVGFQLTAGIWALVESLATQLLYPAFTRRISDSHQPSELKLAYSDLLNTLLPIYFLVAGLLFVGAPYILKLFVAPEYQDATEFFMFGAGIELCRVLGNLLSNAAHAQREVLDLSLPYGVGAFVTLLTIYIFGSIHKGINWASAGLLMGSIVMVTVMGIVMFRKISFAIDFKRCGFGFLIMMTLFISRLWFPMLSSAFQNFLMLLSLTVIGLLLAFAFIWKNASANRLMAVQLRKP